MYSNRFVTNASWHDHKDRMCLRLNSDKRFVVFKSIIIQMCILFYLVPSGRGYLVER